MLRALPQTRWQHFVVVAWLRRVTSERRDDVNLESPDYHPAKGYKIYQRHSAIIDKIIQ